MHDVIVEKPYSFVPPYQGRIWPRFLQIFLRRRLRREFGVVEVECRGLERLQQSLQAGHGVMITPNHCRACDPLVVSEMVRRAGSAPYTMASWHVFMQGRMQRFFMRRAGGLIGQRHFAAGEIGDAVHVWTAPLHGYLLSHPALSNGLLIISSAAIELVGVFLILRSIFGNSLRPFLSLLLLFALRQVCQGLCALPAPDEMIWRNPGFPSLLVTYGVSTDFFFSGHTALAVLGAIELRRLRRPWLTAIGVLLAVFEASAVLVLRAHYTMDVFTGAVTALLVTGIAARLAPYCDRAIASVRRDTLPPRIGVSLRYYVKKGGPKHQHP